VVLVAISSMMVVSISTVLVMVMVPIICIVSQLRTCSLE
jgi:hypothetical protein